MRPFSRQAVRDRAAERCEYCYLPQQQSVLPHEIDHIRARKHHGPTTLDNTCLACAYCNAAKGSNAAGYDSETGELVRLFNPRTDTWHDHFTWDGPFLRSVTPIGRATIDVLRMNDPSRVEHRRLLIMLGLFMVRD